MDYDIDNLELNLEMAESYLDDAADFLLTKVDEDNVDIVTGSLTDKDISNLACELGQAREFLDLVAKKLYQLNLIPDGEGVFKDGKRHDLSDIESASEGK